MPRSLSAIQADINTTRHELNRLTASRTPTEGEYERIARLSRHHARLTDEMVEATERRSEIRAAYENGNSEPGDGIRHRDVVASSDRPIDLARRLLEASSATDEAKHLGTALVEQHPGDGTFAQVIAASCDRAYESAFAKLLSDPQHGHLTFTAAEREAVGRARTIAASMKISDQAAGGAWLVPFAIDPAVVLTNAGSVNPLRQIARVVQTPANVWSPITTGGVTAGWYDEAEELDASTPVTARPEITCHKGAIFVPFSFEYQQDFPNLVAMLGELVQDARDQLEAAAYTTGSGIGQPKGIVTAVAAVTGSRVAATGAGAVVEDDVYKVSHALKPRFRPNARWMGALEVMHSIRRLANEEPNHPFVTLQDANPTLLNRPFSENSTMDGIVSNGGDVLLYGDFRHYVIADRVGALVELIPHLFGDNGRPTGQRGLLMHYRTGADAIVPDAFRVLRVAAP